ncbi:hypothetical protein OESDEN_09779 [Oesophagostomum dentatum]|uniref:Uncharacterized protein n=1 Tax=Oesophagostomum dentatum TaxID=61180 RepID=A0A0B1T2J5_OESDE|nr:hypothetical protein OESDEN_09779 [Oesophagostomum dentatum]
MQVTNTPTNSTPSTPHPKRPTYRTLSISGVSVRTDIEPSPPLNSNVRAFSEQGLSRYSRSFCAGQDSAHRRSKTRKYLHFQQEVSEQHERRRELARRKFDIARETREVYSAIRKKKRAALAKFKPELTPVKSHKLKKVKSLSRSPKKRKEESNVKREVSTSSSSSVQTGNSWKGTLKRFDD